MVVITYDAQQCLPYASPAGATLPRSMVSPSGILPTQNLPQTPMAQGMSLFGGKAARASMQPHWPAAL